MFVVCVGSLLIVGCGFGLIKVVGCRVWLCVVCGWLFVGCVLLVVVCCLLFVVRSFGCLVVWLFWRLLFVVCRWAFGVVCSLLLFVDRCSVFVICWVLCVACFVFRCTLYVVFGVWCCLLWFLCYVLFVVRCALLVVRCWLLVVCSLVICA